MSNPWKYFFLLCNSTSKLLKKLFLLLSDLLRATRRKKVKKVFYEIKFFVSRIEFTDKWGKFSVKYLDFNSFVFCFVEIQTRKKSFTCCSFSSRHFFIIFLYFKFFKRKTFFHSFINFFFVLVVFMCLLWAKRWEKWKNWKT